MMDYWAMTIHLKFLAKNPKEEFANKKSEQKAFLWNSTEMKISKLI